MLDFVRETNTISRDDLTAMLAKMNYNSVTDRGKLVGVLQKSVVPWLPVGSDANGDIYSILPGLDGLLPDQRKPKTDQELVTDNIVGVNINVRSHYPIHSRKANLPEVSTKQNESDDTEKGGFVFHQIGTLQSCGGDAEEIDKHGRCRRRELVAH